MTARLWYPQLDIYDTVRRIALALQYFSDAPGKERLRIVDFYLANPQLIHYTSMCREVRNSFRALKIERPDKAFISYPSPQLLFSKMGPIQNDAIVEMYSKELLSRRDYENGYMKPTKLCSLLYPIHTMATTGELKICDFLVNQFASKSEVSNIDLRKRTGLRKVIYL